MNRYIKPFIWSCLLFGIVFGSLLLGLNYGWHSFF